VWVALDGGADRPTSPHALPSPTSNRSGGIDRSSRSSRSGRSGRSGESDKMRKSRDESGEGEVEK
jgi:hypothetical protein